MDDKKIKLKQTKNPFNTVTRNKNSVFYSADRLTKTQINNTKKCEYPKDKVFLGFYCKLEDENELYFDGIKSRNKENCIHVFH